MSKKYLLPSVAFFLFANGLAAQKHRPNTESGIFLFKGNTNFQFSLADDKPFKAQVGAGYFLFENFVLGTDLGYERSSQVNYSYARPFTRYYFFRRVFLGCGLNGITLAGDSPMNKKFVPDGELGFAIFLDPQVAFEPSARYLFLDGAKPEFSLSLNVFFSFF